MTVECVCKYVKTLFSAGEHTWLFPEPDPCVEVSLAHSSGQTYWTFLQGSLPGQYIPCLLVSLLAEQSVNDIYLDFLLLFLFVLLILDNTVY